MPDLALLALTFVWGTSFLIVHRTLDATSAGVFLSLRFAVATLSTGAVALLRREPRTPGWLRDGLLLGVALFLGFVLQTEGLRFTTPARSGFLTGLSVLFVPVVERFLYRRPVPSRAWLGIALAVAGLALLTAPFGRADNLNVHLGDLLTVGCAFAFSFQIILTADVSARHSLGLLTTVQLGTVALLSLLLLPFETRILDGRPAFIGVLLYTGVIATTFAFLLQNWAQRRMSATRAAVLFTFEPLFAALFSHVVGKEPLGPGLLAGGALIVVGVLLVELARARA